MTVLAVKFYCAKCILKKENILKSFKSGIKN
jgi:hypothetical protein